MSWWAHLECKSCGGTDGENGYREWNYTHNCNGMANTVLDESGFERPPRKGISDMKESWWAILNGMEGPEGAAMLNTIVRGIEADPVRFGSMNPDNGWGDRDSFVKVLRAMRDAVPETPTVWRTSG
jgi:hypothetical protein